MNIMRKFLFFIPLGMLVACNNLPSQDHEPLLDRENASYKRIALGYAYLEEGQWVFAKQNFDKAYAHFDAHGLADLALAEYFDAIDDPIKAKEHFEQALIKSQHFPKHQTTIRLKYARFWCTRGDYDSAEMHLTSVESSGDFVWHDKRSKVIEKCKRR